MAWWVVVDCKNCGRLILDGIYSVPGVIAFRIKDPVRCRRCEHEGKYDGPEFRLAEIPDDVAPDEV